MIVIFAASTSIHEKYLLFSMISLFTIQQFEKIDSERKVIIAENTANAQTKPLLTIFVKILMPPLYMNNFRPYFHKYLLTRMVPHYPHSLSYKMVATKIHNVLNYTQ